MQNYSLNFFKNTQGLLPGNILTMVDPTTNIHTNKFISTDSMHEFQENKKRQPADWIYHSKEITYDLNTDGYRTEEWNKINWKDAVLVFGCSVAFGVGVSKEDTLASQLEQIIGRPVINLGVSGSGNSFILHNTIKYLENFPVPYAVINLWTGLERMHLYWADRIRFEGPWSASSSKDFYFHWAVEEHAKNNADIQGYFSSLAVREIWKNKTHCLEASCFMHASRTLKCHHIEKKDLGRDLLHHGALTNKMAALHFSERLK
jgi:hypothetical protein